MKVLISLFLLNCASVNTSLLKENASKVIVINGITNKDVEDALKKAETQAKSTGELIFKIDSFGGSVFAGLDLIQGVEELKKTLNTPVICIVDTHAMSMGFIFLQAACDVRLMTKRSVLLAHNAQMATSGDSADLGSSAEFLEKLSLAMSEICAERMQMKAEDFRRKVKNSDWTFSWEDALNFKAIDGIINPKLIPMEG